MKNNKYRLQRDIVFLTLSIFLIVFLWIGFNIYDAQVTSTIDEVLQTQIIPIEGTFNTKAVDAIKKRREVNPDYNDSISSPEATFDTESPTSSIEPQTEPFPSITPPLTETLPAQPTGTGSDLGI